MAEKTNRTKTPKKINKTRRNYAMLQRMLDHRFIKIFNDLDAAVERIKKDISQNHQQISQNIYTVIYGKNKAVELIKAGHQITIMPWKRNQSPFGFNGKRVNKWEHPRFYTAIYDASKTGMIDYGDDGNFFVVKNEEAKQ